MTCKYCGAVESEMMEDRYECGTFIPDVKLCVELVRSLECYENELSQLREFKNKIESLFPISPTNKDPITKEVCEKFGMVSHKYEWGLVYFYNGDLTVLFDDAAGKVSSSGVGRQPWCNTAGKLACLIAAMEKS